MRKQIEISFGQVPENQMEILVAKLVELGIHGLQEDETRLIAYGYEEELDLNTIEALATMEKLDYSIKEVKVENWNAIWESNFEPVLIPGRVYVRAEFHPSAEGFDHEILITPKMSFGTGHHATTMMMMKLMLEFEFKGKSVIDFGAGTGILSILAEKLGAIDLLAIDNEYWSVENAKENAVLNNCSYISTILDDGLERAGEAEIILANINKSILLQHTDSISQHLIADGILFISGFLSNDYVEIVSSFSHHFDQPIAKLEVGEWMALVFKKPVNPH